MKCLDAINAYERLYDWPMLKFPMTLKDIKKFEEANNISVNVYSVHKEEEEEEEGEEEEEEDKKIVLKIMKIMRRRRMTNHADWSSSCMCESFWNSNVRS